MGTNTCCHVQYHYALFYHKTAAAELHQAQQGSNVIKPAFKGTRSSELIRITYHIHLTDLQQPAMHAYKYLALLAALYISGISASAVPPAPNQVGVDHVEVNANHVEKPAKCQEGGDPCTLDSDCCPNKQLTCDMNKVSRMDSIPDAKAS